MFYKEIAGVSYDSLMGGTNISSFVSNATIGACEIKRGMLLANTEGVWNPATQSDQSKPLSIAKEDVDSESDRVTQVYTRGEFNRSAIMTGSGVDIDDFEEQLRKDGIYLRDIIVGG